MNVTQVTNAIVASYESKQPLMIWGKPGIGKSSGVKEAAKILGERYYPTNAVKKLKVDVRFGLIDLRLSIREPSDLLGVMWPDQEKKVLRYFQPNFFPKEGRGIIFLDELVQGSQMMQNAASQLILDRAVGEYVLPDGWHVIAAGNQMGDKAATNAMPTHIKNRFVHLYAEVDVDSWISWALTAGVDTRVIAFIKFRRQLLHVFDPQYKGEAFASPRSWEFVSKLLKTWQGDRALLEMMIKGAVGDGPGAEFCGFLRVADRIPSIDGILMNPKTASIPDDMGALYATVTALSGRASKDNLASICAYLNRVTDAGKPDFAMAAIKELTARRDSETLTQTRAFIEFAAKHNHLMS